MDLISDRFHFPDLALSDTTFIFRSDKRQKAGFHGWPGVNQPHPLPSATFLPEFHIAISQDKVLTIKEHIQQRLELVVELSNRSQVPTCFQVRRGPCQGTARSLFNPQYFNCNVVVELLTGQLFL